MCPSYISLNCFHSFFLYIEDIVLASMEGHCSPEEAVSLYPLVTAAVDLNAFYEAPYLCEPLYSIP